MGFVGHDVVEYNAPIRDERLMEARTTRIRTRRTVDGLCETDIPVGLCDFLRARPTGVSIPRRQSASATVPPRWPIGRLHLSKNSQFVSRGGEKLAAALNHFELAVTDLVCADFGSNVGGFVDCLLQRGAARVYAVDTSYGTLAWKLRRDPRVVVRERCNAIHVSLAEPISLVTIDVAWTRQARILPAAVACLAPGGAVLTLVKPHYESPPERLIDGVLPDELVVEVVNAALANSAALNIELMGTFPSPLRGQAGNREVFALLRVRS